MTQDNRPIVAITMGDASGIGPEVIMKALAREDVYAMCRPLVVGDATLGDAVCAHLASAHPTVEVVCYAGGAGAVPLLIGVE